MNIEQSADIRFFDLNSRIGRLRYLAYSIGAMLLTLAGVAVCAAVIAVSHVIGYALVGVVYIAILVLGIGFGVRRLHDLDKTGWLMLLVIVPLVNLGLAIYLIFFPGSDGENRFGPPPPPNSGWVIAGAACYIGLIPLTGIVAAIAIPAYADFTVRAQAVEAVMLAQDAEEAVMRYFSDKGAWPERLQDADQAAATSPAGRYTQALESRAIPNGIVITATFKDTGVNPRLAGKSIAVWTTDNAGTWHCGPAGPDPMQGRDLPGSCRDEGAP